MIIQNLGIQAYQKVWEDMKQFTAVRDQSTPDECWMLEHYPVFTQGLAGKPEHIHNPGDIEVIQSDRGGQVTYHGPGQLVAYTLVDLRRLNIGIRTLVQNLELILISLLKDLGISARRECNAPGVYVGDNKIASIGLRVKNACTYHGIALNVGMDLSPFRRINPCGFAKLQMVQIQDFIPEVTLQDVAARLKILFLHHFEPA